MKGSNFRTNAVDYVIGIDPDSTKSGFALLDVKERTFLKVGALRFPELIEAIREAAARSDAAGKNLFVAVEAGWKNASNWHLRFDSKQVAAAKGRSVGMNHQTGILIVEWLEFLKVRFDEVLPYQKIWKGPDRKITHEELAAFTGISGRTNQESRDAALLAWIWANLPIRLT